MSFLSSPTRQDPFRGYNFLVALIDTSSALTTIATSLKALAAGGFSECSGLEMSLDAEEYREGGNNGTVLRFPTRVKWSNLRLKRGMTFADELWKWHYDFARGIVKRRDGIVALQDERQNPAKVWSFKRGLPVKWTGPMFNATQSQVAIEEIEIAHEGLQVWSLGAGISSLLGIG
jgi:phage tail-like protein